MGRPSAIARLGAANSGFMSKRVEVYQLVAANYERIAANERGHYAIATIDVELGIWSGHYRNLDLPWLH